MWDKYNTKWKNLVFELYLYIDTYAAFNFNVKYINSS